MIKVLHVNDPEIKCYNLHANLLSIIGNNAFYDRWVLNNYTILNFTKHIEKDGLRLDFYPISLWEFCPFINYINLDRNHIKDQWLSVIDFIKFSLKNNYYLWISVDVYYINNYEYFQESHYAHDLFIYGIDEEENVLYGSDNFRNGIYTRELIIIDEFKTAYEKIETLNLFDFLGGIKIACNQSHRTGGFEHTYSIEPKLIFESFQAYLQGEIGPIRWDLLPNRQWMKNKDFYGVEIYDAIIRILTEEKQYKVNWDVRPYFVLWEHKKILYKKVEYLLTNGFISLSGVFLEDFKELVEMANYIRMLSLKYSLKPNSSLLEKIIIKLKVLKTEEIALLKRLLESWDYEQL